MEKQDYIMKQVDKLGLVLGKILADFLGLKSRGQVNTGIEVTIQSLKSELDIDINELVDIPTGDLINKLKLEKKLTNENINRFVEILLLVADNNSDWDKSVYEKCLAIYEYLHEEDSIYSFEREWKIARIKNILLD